MKLEVSTQGGVILVDGHTPAKIAFTLQVDEALDLASKLIRAAVESTPGDKMLSFGLH